MGFKHRRAKSVYTQEAARAGLFNAHIFPEKKLRRQESKKYLRVSKGVTEFKFQSQSEQKGGGTRGKIVDFSRQAQKRMKIRVMNLIHRPEWWQTFTFADDVMRGLSIEARARFSALVLKEFKRKCQRMFPSLEGVWRREWEKRKSGSLKGQLCPHFHMMFYCHVSREEYVRIAQTLGYLWFQLTGTKDPKALEVAVHQKSYEYLDGRRKTILYASKYMAKRQEEELQQSVGRMWGYVGNPCQEYIRHVDYSEPQGHVFKRILKRYARAQYRMSSHRKAGAYARHKRFLAGIEMGETWVMIESGTVDRIFSWMDSLNITPL